MAIPPRKGGLDLNNWVIEVLLSQVHNGRKIFKIEAMVIYPLPLLYPVITFISLTFKFDEFSFFQSYKTHCIRNFFRTSVISVFLTTVQISEVYDVEVFLLFF